MPSVLGLPGWCILPSGERVATSKENSGMFTTAARYRGLLLACVLSVTAALTCACTEQKTSGAAASSQADTTSANSAQTLVPAAFPADNSPLPSITANRAFQYTKEIAAFGPRPIGSAN